MHWLHILQLASNFDRFRTEANTPCGNITGFVQHIQNPVVQSMYSVPRPVVTIKDPDVKYYATLRFALADRKVGMAMTANPSTILQLGRTGRPASGTAPPRHCRGPSDPPPANFQRQSGNHCVCGRRRTAPRTGGGREREWTTDTPRRVWPDMQMPPGRWTAGSAAAYLPRLRAQFPGVTIRDHGLSP